MTKITPQTALKILGTALVLLVAEPRLFGQQQQPLQFYTRPQRGVGMVTNDSVFSINFQFRMQNRALYQSTSLDDFSPNAMEWRVRRLRMKFTGFVLDPKLTYYIQLSFARGDMDWRGPENNVVNNSPNVVRDAVIYYNPTKKLRLGFGQTKLPGNRQRVVSSGDQQFYERSIVNARFNIDRDFGFFGHYTTSHLILRGAITSGEGRNADLSRGGLAYTGRVEFLPFGPFTGENDYIEGDLMREKTLKVSIGVTASHNEQAQRQAGQLGSDLFDYRSINAYEVDMVAKMRGWAWYTEFFNRLANNPVTVSSESPAELSYVYVGQGLMSQLSYLFPNNFEVAGRYSVVAPFSSLYNNSAFPSLSEDQQTNYELGVTRYFYGHRVKVQGGLMYTRFYDVRTSTLARDFVSAVFQFEIGI